LIGSVTLSMPRRVGVCITDRMCGAGAGSSRLTAFDKKRKKEIKFIVLKSGNRDGDGRERRGRQKRGKEA